MSRLRYVIKRVLVAIPTFFGITLLVYILASMTPSSPLEIMFNDPMATKEQMEAMEKSLGLDQPVYVQYFRWLIQLLKGNLGISYRTGLPVTSMVLERIGPTLLLTGSAMLLTVLIALPLGIMAAYKPYSGWDYISSGISFIGAALPNFFAALVLIYIFNVRLKIFPSSGMYDSSGVRTNAAAASSGAALLCAGHSIHWQLDSPMPRLNDGGFAKRLCAHCACKRPAGDAGADPSCIA